MPVIATPTSGAGREDGPGIADRAARLRTHVDLSAVRPLTVVVDAGDGPSAEVLAAVLGAVDTLRVVPLGPAAGATHPDGAQRGPDARRALRAAVIEQHADLGLAVDDAGGALVLDESGAAVAPGVVAVLVGLRVVARERAAGRAPTVVHDLLLSRAVPDLLTTAGAVTVGVRTDIGTGVPPDAPTDLRAGTALHAQTAAHDAVLGAGLDARFAFRDVPVADGGLLAALHVLVAVGGQPHPLSLLVELYQPYAASGHLIRSVEDADAAIDRVEQAYVADRGAGPVQASGGAGPEGLLVSHWDSHPRWWFHLGGTRPGLLDLRVEAADEDIMVKVRDDVLALVQDPA